MDVICGAFDGGHRYALGLRPSLDAETIERSSFSVIKSLCTGRRPVDHQGAVVVGASNRTTELGDPGCHRIQALSVQARQNELWAGHLLFQHLQDQPRQ